MLFSANQFVVVRVLTTSCNNTPVLLSLGACVWERVERKYLYEERVRVSDIECLTSLETGDRFARNLTNLYEPQYAPVSDAHKSGYTLI